MHHAITFVVWQKRHGWQTNNQQVNVTSTNVLWIRHCSIYSEPMTSHMLSRLAGSQLIQLHKFSTRTTRSTTRWVAIWDQASVPDPMNRLCYNQLLWTVLQNYFLLKSSNATVRANQHFQKKNLQKMHHHGLEVEEIIHWLWHDAGVHNQLHATYLELFQPHHHHQYTNDYQTMTGFLTWTDVDPSVLSSCHRLTAHILCF